MLSAELSTSPRANPNRPRSLWKQLTAMNEPPTHPFSLAVGLARGARIWPQKLLRLTDTSSLMKESAGALMWPQTRAMLRLTSRLSVRFQMPEAFSQELPSSARPDQTARRFKLIERTFVNSSRAATFKRETLARSRSELTEARRFSIRISQPSVRTAIARR